MSLPKGFQPHGAEMFVVACAVCKHKRKSPVCDDCLKEKKSGFELEDFRVGRIECFECDSPYCGGCNIFILTKMLQDRKFNCLMDEHRTINPYIEFKPVETKVDEAGSSPFLSGV